MFAGATDMLDRWLEADDDRLHRLTRRELGRVDDCCSLWL